MVLSLSSGARQTNMSYFYHSRKSLLLGAVQNPTGRRACRLHWGLLIPLKQTNNEPSYQLTHDLQIDGVGLGLAHSVADLTSVCPLILKVDVFNDQTLPIVALGHPV